MTKIELGARIREIRTRLGITQEEFAMQCGVAPGHIGNIEKGAICPAFDTLNKIAAGAGISLSELLAEEKPVVHDYGKYLNKIIARVMSLDQVSQKGLHDVIMVIMKTEWSLPANRVRILKDAEAKIQA